MNDVPLRELVANAEVLADTLDNERRPKSAAIIRELIARVVPIKVVPSRGIGGRSPIEVLHEPIVQRKPGAWCDQCDKRVTPAEARACQSRFCKVAA